MTELNFTVLWREVTNNNVVIPNAAQVMIRCRVCRDRRFDGVSGGLVAMYRDGEKWSACAVDRRSWDAIAASGQNPRTWQPDGVDGKRARQKLPASSASEVLELRCPAAGCRHRPRVKVGKLYALADEAMACGRDATYI